MGLNLDFASGQTPLDADEAEGLQIPSITTRGELDEFEQQNIEQVMQWLLSKSFKADQVLTETFVCNLHKRMYGDVWSWAGKFRTTDKNIGIDKWQIPTALKSLLDDTQFWISNKTYSPEEIAIRFKHRLVSIHCFPNGNGRHSRLMADVLIEKVFKLPLFSWGSHSVHNSKEARTNYLQALRSADAGEMQLLIDFAKS